MSKISFQKKHPRIPLEVDGIQVNFCKNPTCANFGVPASSQKQPKGPGAALRGRDTYTIHGSKNRRHPPKITCSQCSEEPPLKSNKGIWEELNRMSLFFDRKEPEPCCPDKACKNHFIGAVSQKEHYYLFGRTKAGSQRYRCKLCGKSFSIKGATTGQKKPHKNKLIFKLLVNKTPFRRICEIAEISTGTLNPKIDFIHRQCLAFAAHKERKLLNGFSAKRLYVSVDQQEYTVNWTQRADKRNTQLFAVGSADNESGYVFGMHLNYDSSLNAEEVENDALAIEDYSLLSPFRKYARFWLQGDYDVGTGNVSTSLLHTGTGLNGQIASTYDAAANRLDVESADNASANRKLPSIGMQVHNEYTLYGHFFYLHRLFGGIEKVRFFLDQDSGVRAACLAAFQPEIKDRACDAFYVRINKGMTVDEKRIALRESRAEFQAAQKEHPELTKNQVKLLLIKQRIKGMAKIGKWRDKWLSHPFPNMSEPEKAVCYLTDFNDYDEDHCAWLYNKASMHGIDCFFMQIRRRLSLLERALSTASATGRRWFGYSAYNPENIAKVLDIFRVFYNYCLVRKDKQTPAMRLGLAKGPIQLEDIIYFTGGIS